MAFCGNCGHPLTGNEKFCAECGAATRTQTAAGPAANSSPVQDPAPAAAPPAPPVIAQPIAGPPHPGAPVAGAVPPPVQSAQKKGALGTVVVIILLAGIGYYFYHRAHSAASPAPTPTPVTTTPATPAPAPAPDPSPAAQTPPAGDNQNGSGDADLVTQQDFNAHWEDQSGKLVLTTATWANNSAADMASATLQCRQYNEAGTDLSEFRVTLTGPTKAQTSNQFTNISLGATAAGMTKVNCSIIHVKPAS
jgi:hypothetical protein